MFRKKVAKYTDDDLKFEPGVINLVKYREYNKKFVVMQLGVDELGYLKMFKPFAEKMIKGAVGDFYKGLSIDSDIMNIINKHSSIEKLSRTLEKHLLTMFDGVIDDAYIDARIRVSSTHVRIGLDTNWYMLSFQLLFNNVADMMNTANFSIDYVNKLKLAVLKMLNLEQQIVLQAYEEKRRYIAKDTEKSRLEQKLNTSCDNIVCLTNEVMSDFSVLLKEASYIVEISETVKSITDESRSISKKSDSHLDKLISQLLIIKTSLASTLSNIKGLEKLNENVYNIITIVDRIADQTNLLSLNASIEAARAGEQGRGFSVVAKEVRELSDKTKKSTEDIRKIVSDLENQLKVVLLSIEELVEAVKKEETDLEIVTEYFKTINLKTEEISDKYVEVMDSILKMNESLILIDKHLDISVEETKLLNSLFNEDETK